ncbi:MAG TPA: sigma-E factor regulatory protein RseB domain-containing protein [Nocardioidaceae bacterium]|nr:sigma-E factor regulatory protein RseB domain-containing protein [Nocardioidaceae bacterium]
MKRHHPAALVLVTTVGLLLFAPAAASARSQGAGDWDDSDDTRAVALLGRAAAALDQVSYSGTRIISSWGPDSSTTVLVDVEHVASQGTLVRMRGGGVADDTAAFLAAGEGDSPQRPDFGPDSLQLLTASYDVRRGAPSRVAGRSAQVVEIAQGATLVARIWVDEQSGLPLRREMFDAAGRLAIESAFIDLRITDTAFLAHLPPSSPRAQSDQVDPVALPMLRERGWPCPPQVGSLRMVGVERMESSSALHVSYSDGLSRVSVFEQRGALLDEPLAGFTPTRLGGTVVQLRVGMPSYAVWEDAGTVYTVVTDAPVDTVAEVVASYPHSGGSESGFWTRVAGGVGRLSAWVTPLV